jgi:histidine triad (HIT) family protein
MTDTCLFCAIGSGDVPADVVLDEPYLLAFRDVSPQAPVHVLVVPKEHHDNLAALYRADPGLMARLMGAAARVAAAEHLDESGFRLVINTGSDGGQTVRHVHVHVLGGRQLTWPPG